MSKAPEGFGYVVRGDGEVRISHHGRPATVLRGAAAARFLVDVERGDRHQLMARVTGNYKRGNERMGKNHPRNRAPGRIRDRQRQAGRVTASARDVREVVGVERADVGTPGGPTAAWPRT
jgi:hypothetical protein